MFKQTILVGVLGLALTAPLAAAQSDVTHPRGLHRLHEMAQRLHERITNGARHAELGADARAKLRTEAQSIRARMKAIRQSGQRPSEQQREEIRNELRQLREHIHAARGGK
jgi:hypothetical protein